jgi:hypothetical protein
MIVVTAELWKQGNEKDKITLGTLYIRNNVTGSDTRGNYSAYLYGKNKRTMNHVQIKGFPRKSKTAWHLIFECLNSLLRKDEI